MKKYLLIVAITFGVLTAVATTLKKDLLQCYGVATSDANYYYVVESVDNLVDGIDYTCIEDPDITCIICTNATPDSFGRVPKQLATVYRNGWFIRF